jgi:hypothetical protein
VGKKTLRATIGEDRSADSTARRFEHRLPTIERRPPSLCTEPAPRAIAHSVEKAGEEELRRSVDFVIVSAAPVRFSSMGRLGIEPRTY